MAGTIVTDRIESDASYASSITVASPMVVSNTISMTNGNITGNVNFDSGTLFVDSVGNNVGVGSTNPLNKFVVSNSGAGGLEVSTASNNISLNSFNRSSSAWIDLAYNANQHIFNRSGTTEAMRIDDSGRVTKPSQPAFRARNASQQTITNDAADIKVNYGTITTNIGSNYNDATSRFTAPVAGWYHFNAFFMLNSFSTNWDYCFIRFLLNGSSSNSELMYGRVTNGTLFITLAGSTYLYLSANDYVEVFTRLVGGSGNATIRNDFSEFQGMLVC